MRKTAAQVAQCLKAAKKAEKHDAWIREADGAEVNFFARLLMRSPNPQVKWYIEEHGKTNYHEISLKNFARLFRPNTNQE